MFFHRQDNDKWIGESEHAKPVVRRSQFGPKIMVSVYFKSIALVHIDGFGPLASSINEQRSRSDIKNMKFHRDNPI
jgi:hypothetical protein